MQRGFIAVLVTCLAAPPLLLIPDWSGDGATDTTDRPTPQLVAQAAQDAERRIVSVLDEGPVEPPVRATNTATPEPVGADDDAEWLAMRRDTRKIAAMFAADPASFRARQLLRATDFNPLDHYVPVDERKALEDLMAVHRERLDRVYAALAVVGSTELRERQQRGLLERAVASAADVQRANDLQARAAKADPRPVQAEFLRAEAARKSAGARAGIRIDGEFYLGFERDMPESMRLRQSGYVEYLKADYAQAVVSWFVAHGHLGTDRADEVRAAIAKATAPPRRTSGN